MEKNGIRIPRVHCVIRGHHILNGRESSVETTVFDVAGPAVFIISRTQFELVARELPQGWQREVAVGRFSDCRLTHRWSRLVFGLRFPAKPRLQFDYFAEAGLRCCRKHPEVAQKTARKLTFSRRFPTLKLNTSLDTALDTDGVQVGPFAI